MACGAAAERALGASGHAALKLPPCARQSKSMERGTQALATGMHETHECADRRSRTCQGGRGGHVSAAPRRVTPGRKRARACTHTDGVRRAGLARPSSPDEGREVRAARAKIVWVRTV